MSEANVAEENDRPLDETPQDQVDEIAEDVAAAIGEEAVMEVVSLTELQRADDRALRAQAELENFRKRARREIEEQRQYANLPLMSDLLPALDNLARALQAAEKNENSAGLLEGVEMVAAQILAVLEQHHCRPIESDGRSFDPHVHEAVAQEASDDLPAGSITRVLQVGYELHGRVVRPSQVMVSTGPADAAGRGNQVAADDEDVDD
jgi:molecular chaperone GrpE